MGRTGAAENGVTDVAHHNRQEEKRMSEDLMAAIDVMAYGYTVSITINGTDIGVAGGRSESKRLFGMNHSMVSHLPENMKSLACLIPGENTLLITCARVEEEDSTGLTIEIKSEEQFAGNDNVYYLREDPDASSGQRTIEAAFVL